MDRSEVEAGFAFFERNDLGCNQNIDLENGDGVAEE